MRLTIPSDQVQALRVELRGAGRLEIGGQLFGEQLGPSDFRVTDVTVQKRPGTFARFVVDLVEAARNAVRFFDRTGHRYTRFNYVGDWHSHPSFEVRPYDEDLATMRDLVRRKDFKGTFAVLMIARLDDDRLSCGAWLFDPKGPEQTVDLEIEE